MGWDSRSFLDVWGRRLERRTKSERKRVHHGISPRPETDFLIGEIEHRHEQYVRGQALLPSNANRLRFQIKDIFPLETSARLDSSLVRRKSGPQFQCYEILRVAKISPEGDAR